MSKFRYVFQIDDAHTVAIDADSLQEAASFLKREHPEVTEEILPSFFWELFTGYQEMVERLRQLVTEGYVFSDCSFVGDDFMARDLSACQSRIVTEIDLVGCKGAERVRLLLLTSQQGGSLKNVVEWLQKAGAAFTGCHVE